MLLCFMAQKHMDFFKKQIIISNLFLHHGHHLFNYFQMSTL